MADIEGDAGRDASPDAADGAILRAGDRVMVLDSRKRRYLLELRPGGEFHTHAGMVSHDDMIGSPEGSEFRTASNARYLVLRPTLEDHILKMPRGAQVIYPKDLGPILMRADIGPGLRVLESGVGSGALSTTLLRAGVDVVGYEVREDHAAQAVENVTAFLGAGVLDRYEVVVDDVYEGLHHSGFDRVLLDLPEPWQVVPHLEQGLRRGGLFLAYNPSIVQVQRLRAALDDAPFAMVETVEVLQRGWHVDGYAVRPDHRMVGHTGFLTTARHLAG